MSDSVNMSLDEIIKKNKEQQNRTSRSRGRGRGGGTVRGRGGGRGGIRGRGGRGRGGRAQSQTRSATPGRQGRSRSRSRSRVPRGRSQSRGRGRSQSRGRSRSRQNFRSQSQNRTFSRSRSRSQIRGLTPKGRAGLEEQLDMPPLVRRNRFNRGGLRRSNSVQNLASNVHSRLGLGVTTRRGAGNVRRPLIRRGVAKRGRGLGIGNIYSNVGLRSDQILQQQRQSLRLQNAQVRSQTFTRSRNNSFSSPSQLTVKVANDYAMGKRRRNSFSNSNYLNQQSLQQLTDHYGEFNGRSGPGSVHSVGSSRSNRSMKSNSSNRSRGRGRGRGRGGRGRGGAKTFVAKQVLNPQLQQEIAAIQGKTDGTAAVAIESLGVNFAPTPATTTLTLHERFGSTS